MFGLLGSNEDDDMGTKTQDEETATEPKAKLISLRKNGLLVRSVAHDCVDTWESSDETLSKPYKIPEDKAHQAKCLDPKLTPIIDVDEPRPTDFDSRDKYKEAMARYLVDLHKAKMLCNSCPVKRECQTASMMSRERLRVGFSAHNAAPQPHLVWGGLSPRERKEIFTLFKQEALRRRDEKGLNNEKH